jgi:hypothetical protein
LDGRESVADESRSGRPCTSKTYENVIKVRALVRSDRRLTVRIIGSELNLNHQTVHSILTEEFGMQKICADAWVLHHDNAVCHAAISVSEFLTKRSIPAVPQPPYSPDLESV